MLTSHWDRLPRDVESRILEGVGQMEHEEKFRGVLDQLPATAVDRAVYRTHLTISRLIQESGGWFGRWERYYWWECGGWDKYLPHYEEKQPDFPRIRAAMQALLVFDLIPWRGFQSFAYMARGCDIPIASEHLLYALLNDDDVFWDNLYTSPQPEE